MGSSQKFIARNRAPRVQIEYDVEVYGAEKTVQLPFVMGVMADLSGQPADPLAPVADRKFLEIDVDNFDARMKAMKPRVAFQVPNTLTGEGNLSVDITFESMDDFSPAAVARKVDSLNKLLQAREQLQNLVTYMDGKGGAEELIGKLMSDPALLGSLASSAPKPTDAPESNAQPDHTQTRRQPWPGDPKHASALAGVTMEGSDLASLLQKEFKPKSDDAKSAVEQAVQTLAQQALAQTRADRQATCTASIESMIAAIDKKLSEQVNQILHHEDFQKIESAWRGLHYMVNNTETDENLKIRVMDISKKDLHKQLKKFKGTAWDQSPMFKKVYEQEYGQFGGEPFGAIVGDYHFDQSPPDVELLGEMAKIAAAAHAPFITGASPHLMQMESWQELANPRDLTKIFLTPEYAGWRSLRVTEDSQYIGLAMPRVLSRVPYGNETEPGGRLQLRGGHRQRRPPQVLLGQLGVRDGDQHQPLLQVLRLGLSHPRHRVGRCGRKPAAAHLPERRRWRRPEVPDRDRDRGPAHGRAGEERLLCRSCTARTATSPPSSAPSRCTSQAEYDVPDASAIANLAARLPYLFAYVRQRALPEVHRARQDRLVRGTRRGQALAVDLDHATYTSTAIPAHSSESTKARKPLAARRSGR